MLTFDACLLGGWKGIQPCPSKTSCGDLRARFKFMENGDDWTLAWTVHLGSSHSSLVWV